MICQPPSQNDNPAMSSCLEHNVHQTISFTQGQTVNWGDGKLQTNPEIYWCQSLQNGSKMAPVGGPKLPRFDQISHCY